MSQKQRTKISQPEKAGTDRKSVPRKKAPTRVRNKVSITNEEYRLVEGVVQSLDPDVVYDYGIQRKHVRTLLSNYPDKVPDVHAVIALLEKLKRLRDSGEAFFAKPIVPSSLTKRMLPIIQAAPDPGVPGKPVSPKLRDGRDRHTDLDYYEEARARGFY